MDDEWNAQAQGGRRLKPGQHVIISLRRMIAEGSFRPGERIAEIATAEALGVSRMPVRTALRALEAEGLVEKLGRAAMRRAPFPRPTFTARSRFAACWRAWRRGGSRCAD